MKVIMVIGLMGLVVTFLSGILSELPFQGTTSTVEDVEDVGDFDKVGEQFIDMYQLIVNDMVSFQQDPSLARAEDRSKKFINAAQNIQLSLRDFAQEFQEKLDELMQLFNTDNQTPASDNLT